MHIADVQCYLQRIPRDYSLSRLVKTHNSDDRAVNWRSRSFKVIDFCCNQKPIYDFLLVINCHLSSLSHSFWDIVSQSRKPPHPTLSPQIDQIEGTTLGISSSHLAGKEFRYWATFWWKLHDPNFSRFVTIHLRHRQTDCTLWQWPDIAMKLQRSAENSHRAYHAHIALHGKLYIQITYI